jgi:hypothetical protein
VTGKELLLKEGISALRAADAFERAVRHLVQRAEILAEMTYLTDDEIARATFLRTRLFIAEG